MARAVPEPARQRGSLRDRRQPGTDPRAAGHERRARRGARRRGHHRHGRRAPSGRRSGRSAHGILLIKSVPIWIDPRQPDVLGTLILGDEPRQPPGGRFKTQTNSEIAFGVNGSRSRPRRCREHTWPALASLLARPGRRDRASRWTTRTISAFANPARAGRARSGSRSVIVLRSQTERLRFLSQLHTQLGRDRGRRGARSRPVQLRDRAHGDAPARRDHRRRCARWRRAAT